jgi:hypothetical protein
MYALVLCVAAAAVGSVGWQRMPDGEMEYIIQLESAALESLRAGQAIQSDISPSAGEVRSFRIIVGTKQLPRDVPLPERLAVYVQPGAAASEKPSPTPPAEVQPEEPPPPWLPLTFTLLGLFASVGANVYLGWIAWDFRRRWRAGRTIVPSKESGADL